jgi:hypothetical protein
LNEFSSLRRFSLLYSKFSGTLKKSHRNRPFHEGGGYQRAEKQKSMNNTRNKAEGEN